MSRRICRIVYRSGAAAALSSTPDLPVVTALLAATGREEARRASDVTGTGDVWTATVRAWVAGVPVPLGQYATRSAALAAEVDYLCRALNRYLARPVLPAHVVWRYAGVRPLYDDGTADPSAVTRSADAHPTDSASHAQQRHAQRSQ
mgnify:CR=1 FL=1